MTIVDTEPDGVKKKQSIFPFSISIFPPWARLVNQNRFRNRSAGRRYTIVLVYGGEFGRRTTTDTILRITAVRAQIPYVTTCDGHINVRKREIEQIQGARRGRVNGKKRKSFRYRYCASKDFFDNNNRIR